LDNDTVKEYRLKYSRAGSGRPVKHRDFMRNHLTSEIVVEFPGYSNAFLVRI